MTIFSLRTDDCLNELAHYCAEFVNQPTGNTWDPMGQPVRVHYADVNGCRRTCVRRFGVDVLDVRRGSDNHDPYNFNA